MRKYYITNDWDGKSYLCINRSMRPNYYWSRFKEMNNRRRKFTLIGAYWMFLMIRILARDININIESEDDLK